MWGSHYLSKWNRVSDCRDSEPARSTRLPESPKFTSAIRPRRGNSPFAMAFAGARSLGHYSGYSYVNRTEVEPMPVDPVFKQAGILWAWLGSPVLAPQ